MADSHEKESKEEQSKKHGKPHNERLENTERDLQIIFKKLRVDNEPKRLKSKQNFRNTKSKEKIVRSKGIGSNRKIIKDATFTYKSCHPRRTKTDEEPDTLSWTLSKSISDKELKSADKIISLTLDGKASKSPNQDHKCASESKELSESCSEQFRRAQCSSMPHGGMNFDDTTPEELAAYFDQLLHIPKPMSAMAEMMYT
ncbi:uncharacterized protein LOC116308045 [Actinia tenebrosa]|uniref:Oxidative stress-responsive serine-rich protein 1 n=1 Tax=Actinia tenebrosa TaxID=6105 RepID=A0A6P8J904_ACTTE|nr:uncharacterized protein LOC116308045 [Actinia tenebrosa]